jgi:hypothetical protein
LRACRKRHTEDELNDLRELQVKLWRQNAKEKRREERRLQGEGSEGEERRKEERTEKRGEKRRGQ